MATYSRSSDVMRDIHAVSALTPNISNFTSSIRSIADAARELNRIRISDRNDSLLSFINKARDMRRADRIMSANQGVFASRNKALEWFDKSLAISRDEGGNRFAELRKHHGDLVGRSLFNQENAQLFTNRMAEIGRSPRQQRIFDYYQQFGGAASADAMDRAEDVVRAEDERKRSEERLEGRRAFAYDTADDYTKMRHDLRDKYKSSALVDAKIRQDALKKLPSWMKNLVDNSKLSTKFLFNMSKGLAHAKNIPFFGKMLSDPVTAGVALGMGSIALMKATSERADEANKNIVSQMNARNVYGPVSQTFLKTAHLAGIQDPTKIQELWGKLTTKYGDADAFLSSVGSHTAEMKGGKAKTFLAQALGFDPTLMAMADMYGGGFWNLGAMSERMALGDLARTKMIQDQMTRTGSGLLNTIVGTFSNASVASRFVDDDKFYNDIIFKKFKTDSAVNSQDSYQREYSTGASNSPSGGKVINVSISTGDVVLPNAKDGQSFADDLFDFSEKKTGTLHAFDSGIK